MSETCRTTARGARGLESLRANIDAIPPPTRLPSALAIVLPPCFVLPASGVERVWAVKECRYSARGSAYDIVLDDDDGAAVLMEEEQLVALTMRSRLVEGVAVSKEEEQLAGLMRSTGLSD